MFLVREACWCCIRCFLHVCGDVSPVPIEASITLEFSPRMWRCFLRILHITEGRTVFSTYVEMFPPSVKAEFWWMRFLHVCGDVSRLVRKVVDSLPFSPRMWRCFSCEAGRGSGQGVFSTYVEMFLQKPQKDEKGHSFLYMCGVFWWLLALGKIVIFCALNFGDIDVVHGLEVYAPWGL